MINSDKKNKKEKKNALTYDEYGGLIFMKNWPSALRWGCVLPAIVVAWLVVKVLFLSPILNMLEKESFFLSFYLAAITSGLVYIAMVDAAASTAPTKRVLTSIIVAIVLGVFVVAVTILTVITILNADILRIKTHYLIAISISCISSLFGLWLGVSIVKDRQKKVPKAPQSDINSIIK